MLVMLLYMCAIVFLMGCFSYFRENQNSDDADHQFLVVYWSSIGRAMCTLYMTITGGVDWATVADPLAAVGEHYFYLFVAYIAFFSLAVLNVLTGIFCEAAMEVATRANTNPHVSTDVLSQAERVYTIFRENDTHGCLDVSWPEIRLHMERPEVKEYFDMLSAEEHDLFRLFVALSGSADGRMLSHEFLSGCMDICGDTRKRDIVVLSSNYGSLRKQLVYFETYTRSKMESLQIYLCHWLASTHHKSRNCTVREKSPEPERKDSDPTL